MCQFPGASSTRPGRMASPFSASLTDSSQHPSRRSANAFVNTGGMCCTTTMPTGRSPGSICRTVFSATGPPVDVPIATSSYSVPSVNSPRGTAGPGGDFGADFPGADVPGVCVQAAGAAGGADEAAGGVNTMREAFFTFSVSSCATELIPPDREVDGFRTKSTAPRSSACRVSSAPFCACALSTMIGVGLMAMIRRMASSPPMPGISRSSVMTSGFSLSSFGSANSACAAVATTVISGSAVRISEAILRTRAESSTTMTRITGSSSFRGVLLSSIDRRLERGRIA